MALIQLLEDQIINKISAGEVIERPSQVFKELIENSLDAGATKVEISIEQSLQSFSIIDNGHGMDSENLPKSILRHATSKVTDYEDLWSLTSFGFRGEALASLSAVSELSIFSKTKNCLTGHELKINFSKDPVVIETDGTFGTAIYVKNLFENVPTRLKFLKSDKYELTKIKDVIYSFIIANPEVEFKLSLPSKKGAKKEEHYPIKLNLVERMQNILKIDTLYEVEGELSPYKVKLFLAPPTVTARSWKKVWTFVNKRWIQEKAVLSALKDGFYGSLMHGEYPVAIVQIESLPGTVDFNVHPTKTEVKFLDSQKLFRMIHNTVRLFNQKAPWLESEINNTLVPKTVYQGSSLERDSYSSLTDKVSHASELQNFKNVNSNSSEDFMKSKASSRGFSKEKITEAQVKSAIELFKESQNSTLSSYNPENSFQSAPQPMQESFFSKDEQMSNKNEEPLWSNLKYMGQVKKTYLILESERDLFFVDQHAAHERIIFNKLQKNFSNLVDVEKQMLLLPVTLNLSEIAFESLKENKEYLSNMGFVVQFYDNYAELNGFPPFLKEPSVVKAIESFAVELSEVTGSKKVDELVGDVFATMACHSAVRAGDSLNTEQARSLLDQLDESQKISFCPHGRPIYVKFTYSHIERLFGRVV